MNKKLFIMSLVTVLLGFIPFNLLGDNKKVGDLEFIGPFEHKNLTVYLIKDETAGKDKKFTPLAVAMKNKWLNVHETGNVNQLSVENTSDKTVFIQSGDIVRGGKQDRVLSVDLVVLPNSGKIPIASFCVESNRWAQRKGEMLSKFNKAGKKACGSYFRNSLRSGKNQSLVWQSVAENQTDLSSNLNVNVKDVKSASSFQLSLENKKLNKTAEEYLVVMRKALKEHPNSCGMVFLVNNKFSNAEIFNNVPLFQETGEALLEAAANEAIMNLDKKTEEMEENWMNLYFSTDEQTKKTKTTHGQMSYTEQEHKKFYRFYNYFQGKPIHSSIDTKNEKFEKLKNQPNNSLNIQLQQIDNNENVDDNLQEPIVNPQINDDNLPNDIEVQQK